MCVLGLSVPLAAHVPLVPHFNGKAALNHNDASIATAFQVHNRGQNNQSHLEQHHRLRRHCVYPLRWYAHHLLH